jgi:hypothetical protein
VPAPISPPNSPDSKRDESAVAAARPRRTPSPDDSPGNDRPFRPDPSDPDAHIGARETSAAALSSASTVRPMQVKPGCTFRGIVAGEIPSTTIAETDRAIAFMDINPVTEGHALVVPREHASDLGRRPRRPRRVRTAVPGDPYVCRGIRRPATWTRSPESELASLDPTFWLPIRRETRERARSSARPTRRD